MSNNVPGALTIGTNLALCYLGAKEYKNAYILSGKVLEASLKTKNLTVERLVTIRTWCLFKTGKTGHYLTVDLKRSSTQSLDSSAFSLIMDTYEFLGDRIQIENWEKEWADLRRAIK
jgi:hypothetical protein